VAFVFPSALMMLALAVPILGDGRACDTPCHPRPDGGSDRHLAGDYLSLRQGHIPDRLTLGIALASIVPVPSWASSAALIVVAAGLWGRSYALPLRKQATQGDTP